MTLSEAFLCDNLADVEVCLTTILLPHLDKSGRKPLFLVLLNRKDGYTSESMLTLFMWPFHVVFFVRVCHDTYQKVEYMAKCLCVHHACIHFVHVCHDGTSHTLEVIMRTVWYVCKIISMAQESQEMVGCFFSS
jgi:hypothetical protein